METPFNFAALTVWFCVNALPGGALETDICHSCRDVIFIVTLDCHYDAFESEDRNDCNGDTIREMNRRLKYA